MAFVEMESTVIHASVVLLSQVNTVRWNRIPVSLILVKGEECVFHHQITPLIPVDVPMVGKVHAVMKM